MPLVRKSKLRKLSPLTALKRKAWKIFSLFVRKRDKVCITCGSSNGLQAGHFVHGDNMDFVIENINAQCVRCNKWLHGNLGVYAIKIDEKYGLGTAKRLIALGRVYRGYRRKDFEEIIELYGSK